MGKNFEIVDAVPTYFDRPGKNYLNSDGIPLTGCVKRDTKMSRVMTFCYNGSHIRSYKYPLNITPPYHKMVNWDNLKMCGGFTSRLHKGMTPTSKLIDGTKPVAHEHHDTKELALAAIEEMRRLGFQAVMETTQWDETIYYHTLAGVPVKCDQLFPLEEYLSYYKEVIYTIKDTLPNALLRMTGKTPVEVLSEYQWADPKDDTELIMTGLCLGYPIESTASLINGTAI